MYGTEIKDKAGKIIRRSKNLRAMRDYNRVSAVTHVTCKREPGILCRGVLTVAYADGCMSTASFSSYHIMVDWVRNRRSWRGAEFDIQEDVGYLTKPGIIAGR